MNSRTLFSTLAALSLLTAVFATGCAETTGNTPNALSRSSQQQVQPQHRERESRDR